MKKLLLPLAALLVATSVKAAEKVSNGYLEVSQENSVLMVSAKGKTFVRNLTLPSGIKGVSSSEVSDAKWGEGSCLAVTQNNGWETTFTLYKGQPFVFVHTTVNNVTDKPYVANKWHALGYEVDLGVPSKRLRVIGTAHNRPLGRTNGSYAYMAVADPMSRNGVVMGWLTHERGVGIFQNKNNDGKVKVDAGLNFGHFLVKPNKSRVTDTFVLGYFDDARVGLEDWAGAVAREYAIKLPKKRGVYCTWYHRKISGSGASTEKMLAENTDYSEKNLKPYGLEVMQIDDQWQCVVPKGSPGEGQKFKKIGPYKCFADVNGHFPSGMKATAEKIAAAGMVPGIWFMPFAGNHHNPFFDKDIFVKKADGTPFVDTRWSGTCIDSTSPKGEAFIRERVKRIYDWGYRYFKIDGLHTGMPSTNLYINAGYRNEKVFGDGVLYNPDMTYVQCFRHALDTLHDAAPGVFVLGCSTTQNMCAFGPSFGEVDAMRVGPDNDGALSGHWGATTAGARFSGNVYFLNGRVWYNDPDPFYVRKSNPLEKVRWMASWLAVSGSTSCSSNQYENLPAERLDIIKRTLPTHDLKARPVDFLDTARPAFWIVNDDRINVAGLFNWSDKSETTVSSTFERMGLDQSKKYVAFEFWSNQFLGTFSGKLTRKLPKCGAEVIAFREAKPYPQVLSTSRNINQGLTDVISEKWDPAMRTLSGESLVVAGDSYELRIATAKGFSTTRKVFVDGKKIDTVKAALHGVRVTIHPEKTGRVTWAVQF